MTSIYLGSVSLCTWALTYTFSSRRSGDKKLSDTPGVVIAVIIYVTVAFGAMVMSGWLGVGVYFWPETALQLFGFTFQQAKSGVSI